jgi:hypothetical protein
MTSLKKYGGYLLVAFWLLCIILIAPWADIPVNDDWAYAHAALNFSKGYWHYSDWQGMTLFSQAAYGALWIKLFGFSYTILRVSMLIPALLCSRYFFLLIDKFSGRSVALLGTASVLFNPVFLHLSLSFMTDVFALCCALAGSWYLVLYGDSAKNKWFFYALLSLLIGVLCRQIVLIIPIAFLISALVPYLSFKWAGQTKTSIVPYIVITGLTLISLWLHDYFYSLSGALPANYAFQGRLWLNEWFRNPVQATESAFYYGTGLLVFTGIMMLPVRIAIPFNVKHLYVFFLVLLLVISRYVLTDFWWPFTGDVWHSQGVGPVLLPDTNSNEFQGNYILAVFLALFAAYSWSAVNYKSFRNNGLVWLMVGVFMVLPMVGYYVSDRYFLPAAVFLFIWYVRTNSVYVGNNRVFGITAAWGVVMLFSVNSNFFYHRFLDANHSLFLTAKNKGIEEELNAGFALNAEARFSFAGYDAKSPGNSWNGKNQYKFLLSPQSTDSIIYSASYSDVFGCSIQKIYLVK